MPPRRTPEAALGQGSSLSCCSGLSGSPPPPSPQVGLPNLGGSWEGTAQGATKKPSCPPLLQLGRGPPDTHKPQGQLREPKTFSHLRGGWGRSVAPTPSFGKPRGCAALHQQHLSPWGCGPRRVSFQTPQSSPLAEIAGSEHKHCRLSLPPPASHQPGMVSSPSIHHEGFLSSHSER